MDADEVTTVRVERVIEPLSGMALLRVTGYWQAPASTLAPLAVEVYYDLQVASRARFTTASAADLPDGFVRLNYGTQLPVEPATREVAVVLVAPSGATVLYQGPFAEIGREEPVRPPSLSSRVLRALTSKSLFSRDQWHARFARPDERGVELGHARLQRRGPELPQVRQHRRLLRALLGRR